MKKTIIVSLFFILVLTGCGIKDEANQILTPEEAKAKGENFINDYLMSDGIATVKEVTEEDGLYKLTIDIGGDEDIDSFLSKDGKDFYPQVISIAELENQATEAESGSQTASQTIVKSDKPQVELFVMSHCPFGTQIEKGIIPVLKNLGDTIDFELKFCDYAMHGEKELKEQLNQYCIQKNEPDKLISYLECFLEAGEGEQCISEVGIDSAKLSSCVSETDAEYKVMESFNDKSTWLSGSYPIFDVYKTDNEKYNIGGSPALVINGVEISSARNASSLQATICSAFSEQPGECSNELSSDTPSSGFGYSGTGSNTTATCN